MNPRMAVFQKDPNCTFQVSHWPVLLDLAVFQYKGPTSSFSVAHVALSFFILLDLE